MSNSSNVKNATTCKGTSWIKPVDFSGNPKCVTHIVMCGFVKSLYHERLLYLQPHALHSPT